MRYFIGCLLILFYVADAGAQSEGQEESIIQTFRHSRIINSHSVETLPARKLDFRIVHRLEILQAPTEDGLLFMDLKMHLTFLSD